MTFQCYWFTWAVNPREKIILKISAEDIQRVARQLNSTGELALEPVLDCSDHTVSRETFTLYREPERDLLITLPQPSARELPGYYDSEDYISHTESRRNLIEKLYHQVKEHSLKRKLKIVNRACGGEGRLLDIGCGTGDFLKTCSTSGWSVTGIEPNRKARTLAEQKIESDRIYSSLQELSDSDTEGYDVITMWHVLEHLPDLYEQIARIKSLLNPQGSLIVAVPNFNSSDALHYGAHWAAYDVPRHLWHFSRSSIKGIFSDFDMRIVQEIPLYFDSFYVSLLSEKYRHGKQRLFSAFYQGLRSNMRARATGEYSSIIYWLK